MVEKKTIRATEAKVMKKMDYGNPQGESRGIHRGGKAGQAVLDHPEVETARCLQAAEIFRHLLIVPSPENKKRVSLSQGEKLLRGAIIILNAVAGVQCGGKQFREALFAPRLEVAAEDLENAEPRHIQNLREVSPAYPTRD